MKNFLTLITLFLALNVFGQNKSLTNGSYFSTYYLSGAFPFTGGISMLNDDNGSGTFDGGTYTYTFNENNNILLDETVDGVDEDPAYIGSVDTSGEYCILIGDPVFENAAAIASIIKSSSGKTNASFAGDYITSYFRYSNSSDKFAGLFTVNSDGIDSCIYEYIMGTESVPDEGFDYVVNDEGSIALSSSSIDSAIIASINATENAYQYASQIPGFAAIGFGIKVQAMHNVESFAGTYKAIQLRYSNSWDAEVASLLTLEIYTDSTGTYTIDTSSHDAGMAGSLKAVSQTDGIWEIVLDDDTDYTLYCALNTDEKLMTGYFNYRGESPGIIYAIPYAEPDPEPTIYTVSGTVSGADDVNIQVSGDVTETIPVTNDGDTYSFEIEEGQSVTITPTKVGYRFTPASINISAISDNTGEQDFTASRVNSLGELENTGIAIYPNPAKEYITVKSPSNSVIELLNTNGKTLGRYITNSETYELNLNGIEAGIYLMRVSNNQNINRFKVVKH